jgi:hypothetical protein
VTLNNTIVAGNFNGPSPGTSADDISGTVHGAYNLIGVGGSGGLQDHAVDAAHGNQVGVANPGLAAPGDYGGSSGATVALLPGSPALNAGSNALAVDDTGSPLSTDQRGFLRIADGTVDIGAFEKQTASLPADAFLVTNTNDSGPGSLRQAILNANLPGVLDDGPPTITFASGLAGTIQLGSELLLSHRVTIQGPGADQLAVSGTSSSRVFDVRAGATISGLTIENGNAHGVDDLGGGIYATGLQSYSAGDTNLTVTGCVFSNNDSDEGGGIFSTVPLLVTSSTFRQNSAVYNAGGISAGTVTVSDSTFLDNAAGYGGGGIVAGRVTVSDSTFTGNAAGTNGGGLSAATLNVVGSTFVGNTAGAGGGGLFGGTGSLTVNNSTFFGNAAAKGGGIYLGFSLFADIVAIDTSTLAGNTAGEGGGIWEDPANDWADDFDPTVGNTIVAGNTATSDSPDVYGVIRSNGDNLIGDAGSSRGFWAVGDQVGTAANPKNPLLAPLGDYGGPTQTMALLPGSPALGNGNPALAVDGSGRPLLSDQRGFGFLRTVNDAGTPKMDIGAFQTQPSLSSQGYLQAVVNGSLPINAATGNRTATLVLDTQSQANAFLAVFATSNALTAPTAPDGTILHTDLAVSLAPGIQLTEAKLNVPAGFRVAINGGAWHGGSPALTLEAGDLVLSNATFENGTDAPTILVQGGILTLRNDVVQESTGYSDAAIAVTGGTLDLGTAASPGGNTLNVNGSGEWVHNSTANAIPTVGNTFTANGTPLAASTLSFTSVTASAATTTLNQPLTLTATVRPDGTGTPSGSVDFFDTTTNTDLGSAALSGGTASLTTAALPVGTHVIQARYGGDGTLLPSQDTVTVSVRYHFSGFLPPLGNGLQFGLNRTVPVKFQLSDNSDKAVTSLSAVTALQVAPVVNGVAGTPLAPASSDGKGLRSTGGQYSFNWSTKGLAAGTYQVQLRLADGTLYTRTVQLTANGNGKSGLVADGSAGSAAGATAGGLLGGDLTLYVDNSAGNLTADELAAIDAAVGVVDATVNPYGVNVTETTDPTAADVVVSLAGTTALGGAADGVLGCESDGQVTLVSGWSWYAGSDPTQIGAGQYDFETVFVHELGHALGLGHSTDATSVMYPTLAAGATDRALTAADLNVADTASGACGLHAALPAETVAPAAPAPASDVSPNGGASASPAPVATVAAAPTHALPADAAGSVPGPAAVGAGLPLSSGTLPGGLTGLVESPGMPASQGTGAAARTGSRDGPSHLGDPGLRWQWVLVGDGPTVGQPGGPWDLGPPAEAGRDVPPADVTLPGTDREASGSGGDGQAGDASSGRATADGAAWFFPADERGSQDGGLLVGWAGNGQEEAADPEELRAGLAAVFEEL